MADSNIVLDFVMIEEKIVEDKSIIILEKFYLSIIDSIYILLLLIEKL